MQATFTNRELLQHFKPLARPCKGPEGQAKGCSPTVQRVDFLRSNFQPKVARVHKSLNNQKKVEQGFFKSLALLTDHYGLKTNDFSGHLYPINLHRIIEDVNGQIKDLNRNLYLNAQRDEKGIITFETEQNIWGGGKLYYLPVEPLYELFFQKDKAASKDLLLSVFAYLYQTVKLSYFKEENSYLFYRYDMINDWLMDAEDEDHNPDDVESEFNHMRYSGDIVLHEISQSFHLEQFEHRLNAYSPVSPVEHSIYSTCLLAFDLMRDYPGRSFHDNIVEHEMNDDDYGVICPEHYLCFFWSYNGMFYDQLWDTVNVDLQEYTYKDKPVNIRFDGSPLPEKTYEFEARVLNLVEELCDSLNDLENE